MDPTIILACILVLRGKARWNNEMVEGEEGEGGEDRDGGKRSDQQAGRRGVSLPRARAREQGAIVHHEFH